MEYFILLSIFLSCFVAGRYIYSISVDDLTISELSWKVFVLVHCLPYIALSVYLLMSIT